MNSKALALALLLAVGGASAAVLTGPAAWGDWTSDAPGVTRKITLDSLPAPGGAFHFAARRRVRHKSSIGPPAPGSPFHPASRSVSSPASMRRASCALPPTAMSSRLRPSPDG